MARPVRTVAAVALAAQLLAGCAWLREDYSLPDMLAAHDIIRSLADSDDHVLPAHDPRLRDLYPAIDATQEGRILRLDVPPSEPA